MQTSDSSTDPQWECTELCLHIYNEPVISCVRIKVETYVNDVFANFCYGLLDQDEEVNEASSGTWEKPYILQPQFLWGTPEYLLVEQHSKAQKASEVQ